MKKWISRPKMRTTWKIPMGNELIITGAFRASTINSPFQRLCPKTADRDTDKIPIIRKNNSRLCSHHLTQKGIIRTMRAMIISPTAHPHTGATGNVTITNSGISNLFALDWKAQP
jgi:hypothetical protein